MIGLGALTAGGSAAFGTEAFTSVEAQRNVDVTVAGDQSAFVAIKALGSQNAVKYVSEEGDETIQLNLDDDSRGSGGGVPQDAVTQVEELFSVINQGSQPVAVYFTDNSDAVTFRKSNSANNLDDTGSSLEGASDSVVLGVGEQVKIGMTVDTREVSENGQLLDDVTMVADAKPSAGSAPTTQYVVDGEGSSDSTFPTIQEAVDAAAEDGISSVFVEPGKYDETVIIEETVTLRGPGAGTPSFEDRDNDEATITGDGRGIVLRAYNNDTNEPYSGTIIDGLRFAGTEKSAIINIDETQNGIQDISIINNKFVDIGTHCLKTPSADVVTGLTLSGNLVQGIDGNSSAFYLFNVSDSIIQNNVIDGESSDGDTRGIQIDNSNVGDGTEPVTIENNLIENTGAKGIQVANAPNTEIVLTNNTLNNNGSDNGASYEGGLAIYPNVGNLLVENNTFANNSPAVAVRDKSEQEANYSEGVTIQNNNIESNNDGGARNPLDATLDATNNWWGADDGPSGGVDDPETNTTANGTGASIEGNVLFDSFADTTFEDAGADN